MIEKSFADWQALVTQATPDGRALIDGERVWAVSGQTFADTCPIHGQVLAQVADCGEADVDAAVQAARRSFQAGVWCGLRPVERKAILLRFAALINEHREELALLETLDAGKPIRDTLAVDIPGAAYTVAWYAETVDKVGGEVAPVDPRIVGLVTREPIGVVACVVPWNFPLLMAAWKFAPALAAGNSVILKPSEKSPLTALRVGQLALEAGIPPGVFNVLPGQGAAGRALALHPDVDCIAFTGSNAVGRQIMQAAAQSNLKRVWLELGGKSPNIILPDCPDLDKAAATAAAAIFYNTGQMCTAGSRLLVHRDIREDFIARLVERAGKWLPGNPLDPATRMGPIIDPQQWQRVQGFLAQGRAESRLRLGGDTRLGELGGIYLNPTVFEAEPGHAIAREEIFGPVLAVLAFDTLDEAIALANDSPYGLAAAVWTANLNTAHLAARRLRAGTVWVNCYDEGGDMNFPFGGFRQSGNGRDKSLHALDKYTELKSTLIRLP